MSDRDDSSTAFTDFSGYFERLIERAWEVGPESEAGDAKALFSDMRTLTRAFMLGPAGVPLLFSPRNRDMLHRMLYVYGFIEKRDDENHQQLKELTKDILLACLELADEGRRHRNELWKINRRLMQKLGEVIEEVTAEFNERKP
jgi:hypothetical protein